MPFQSDKQRKFLFKEKPKVAKKLAEHAESSAASGALFKEDIPSKLVVGDVFLNKMMTPPKASRQLEGADQQDTLMGRLASRMASRDMIDELNMGPKGRTGQAKKAVVADTLNENEVPSKLMLGAGLHFQTADKVTLNMSDPHITSKVREGSNMAEQAKNAGNIYDTGQLAMGKKVESEHNETVQKLMSGNVNKDKATELIAKDHLKEIPDYYSKLKKMESKAKK